MSSFIGNLKNTIAEANLPWLIASLRQDIHVWQRLQDNEFASRAIKHAGDDLSLWSPASLSILALTQSVALNQLQDPAFNPPPQKIRHLAADSFEKLTYTNPKTGDTLTLEEAGLLAIALRERRRSVGSWDGIVTELQIAPTEYWNTVIACLMGMLPDPKEFLAYLLISIEAQEFQALVIHAILANPYPPEKSIELLYDLINQKSLDLILRLLQSVNVQRPILAKIISQQVLADIAVQNNPFDDDLGEIQFHLLKSELLRLSGDLTKADRSYQKSWDLFESLRDDRIAQMAISSAGNDDTNLDEKLSRRVNTANSENRKGPETDEDENKSNKGFHEINSLLIQAISTSKESNKEQAVKYAKKILVLIEQSADSFKKLDPEFANQLTELLFELDLFQETVYVSKLGLSNNPSDPRLLSTLSRALVNSQNIPQAIEAAELATGLDPENLEYLRRLSKLFVDSRNWSDAYTEVEALVSRQEDPDEEDLISLANCAFHSNNPSRVVEITELLLSKNEKSGIAHALRGEALLNLGKKEEAKEHLNKASVLSPHLPTPWVKLAEYYDNESNSKDALRTLLSGVKFAPSDVRLQFALGKSLLSNNETPKALAAFEIAAELVTNNVNNNDLVEEVSIELAKTFQELGNLEQAQRTLESAHRAYPAHPMLAYALGNYLLTNNQPKAAIPPLLSAKKALPETPETHLDYARAHLAQNQFPDEAYAAVHHVLEIDPNNPYAKALLADAALLNNQPEEAYNLYDEALNTEISNDDHWHVKLTNGKALAALKSDRPQIAIDLISQLHKKFQPESSNLKILSDAYYQANMFEDALESAQQAYSLLPESSANIQWFADQAYKLDAIQDAITALEKAYHFAPLKTNLLSRIGHLHIQNGDPEAGKEAFMRLFFSSESSPKDLQSAAEEFTALGESDESIKFLQRALELESDPSPSLLKELADAYRSTGNLDKALDVIDRHIELSPNDLDLLTSKTKVLIELRRYKGAIVTIDKSLELNPGNAYMQYQAAKLLVKTGELSSALDYANKAINLDPEDRDKQILAAEISMLCFKPRQAWEILNKGSWSPRDFISENSSDNNPDEINKVGLIGEIAIADGHFGEAKQYLAAYPDGNHARLLALESRIAFSSGEQDLGKRLLEKAQQRYKHSNTDFNSPSSKTLTEISIAEAAINLKDYKTAISILTNSTSLRLQPFPSFKLAQTIILRAEYHRNCINVEAFQHAPGEISLGQDAQDQFLEAIKISIRGAPFDESRKGIKHWEARGNDVFDITSLEGNLKSYPQTAEETATMLASLHRRGDVNEARTLAYSQPQHPALLFQMALLFSKEDLKRSLSNSIKAADLDDNPLNNALVAKLAHQSEDTLLASKYIEEALTKWPDEPRWQLLAGRLFTKMDQTSAGIVHLEKAVQLEPNYGSHHYELGKAYSQSEIWAKAIEEFKFSTNLDPKKADSWLGLSNAYLRSGDFSKASSAISKALKLAPNQPESLVIKADIELANNQPAKAQKLIKDVLLSDPENLSALTLLAKSYIGTDQPEEAAKAFDIAIQKSPDPVPLLLKRVIMIESSKDKKVGIKELKQLADQYPKDIRVLAALSEALSDADLVEDAIKVSQHALKTIGNNTDVHDQAKVQQMLGTQLKVMGQLDKSVHHLNQAIVLAPQSVKPYLELGEVYQMRRNPKKALEYFQQATDISPLDARCLKETGIALKDCKDYNAAEHMLRRAASITPHDPAIQKQLAAVIALNLVHPPSPREEIAAA